MSPGDLVAGRYRLEHLLGKGGMGEVWAAVHTVTEQRRALKLVDEDDEGTRRRMLREARAACAVRHPNVVSVHDVVEGERGAPVLVMDLLEGETLADKLEREGALPVREVVAIAMGIASGLEAAHALGIVHRDLKPANVFLTPDPKILDFGVAKLTATSGPARATNLLTESGAMVGTPCYMAPEQAFGDGEVDARTDLWALGVVLYECLAGVRPADGATVGQVFKVLATSSIVPLAVRAPHVPGSLTAIVDALLTTDRDKRPASAREVREALARVDVSGPPASLAPPAVSVSPPGGPTETTDATAILATRPAPRRTSFALAAAALVAVVAAVATFRAVGASPERPVAARLPNTLSFASTTLAAAPEPSASPPAPAPSASPPSPAPSPISNTSASPKSRPKPAPATPPSPPPPGPTSKLLTEPLF